MPAGPTPTSQLAEPRWPQSWTARCPAASECHVTVPLQGGPGQFHLHWLTCHESRDG